MATVLHDLVQSDGHEEFDGVGVAEDFLCYEAVDVLYRVASRVVETGNVSEIYLHVLVVDEFWQECLALMLGVAYLQ